MAEDRPLILVDQELFFFGAGTVVLGPDYVVILFLYLSFRIGKCSDRISENSMSNLFKNVLR